KKDKFLAIKIKRASLLVLCLSFFLFPGQNWYATVQATYQPAQTQDLNFPLPPVANYPVNFSQTSPPSLTARSAAVVDRDSAVLLYGRNEKLQLLPASTVKMMTALVALDDYSLDEVLTVGEINDEGQDIKLIKGEKITVKNLLYGLLVASGNDVALVLAQNYPGGEINFVKAMNDKAQSLGLKETYFANPTGLDSNDEGEMLTDFSYTTASDLARLAALVLANETFLGMASTQKITISDVSGKIFHQLENINQLVGKFPGMKGLKTGWTEEAGECLVGYTERDGHGLITVIMGSQDRFGETVKLVDWVFDNFQWQAVNPSI
ncbi:serine hydrolase, partial [Patescibacteria group bacterium]|nr:serine hydrolase [Patescibacteria group bacterium]